MVMSPSSQFIDVPTIIKDGDKIGTTLEKKKY